MEENLEETVKRNSSGLIKKIFKGTLCSLPVMIPIGTGIIASYQEKIVNFNPELNPLSIGLAAAGSALLVETLAISSFIMCYAFSDYRVRDIIISDY